MIKPAGLGTLTSSRPARTEIGAADLRDPPEPTTAGRDDAIAAATAPIAPDLVLLRIAAEGGPVTQFVVRAQVLAPVLVDRPQQDHPHERVDAGAPQ